MSDVSEFVRALVAAGATPEAILIAVEAFEGHRSASYAEEMLERRRASDRERKRRSRAIQEIRQEAAERILRGEPVNPRALGINPRAIGTNPRARLK